MILVTNTIERLGELDPNYREIVRGVVAEEGLLLRDVRISPEYLTVVSWAPEVDEARAASARIEARLPAAILARPTAAASSGSISITNHGQIGSVGHGSEASANSFQQTATRIEAGDAAALADELERLYSAIKGREHDDEAVADAGAAAQAKVAGKKGNLDKALGFLAQRGRRLLDEVEKLGLPLLAKYLAEKILHLPPNS